MLDNNFDNTHIYFFFLTRGIGNNDSIVLVCHGVESRWMLFNPQGEMHSLQAFPLSKSG